MKKLSIILLALAFALVMAVPAMAIHVGSDQTAEGGLGITGTYKIDGQSDDRDGTKEEWYDDDFELVMKYSTGAVTAVIDLEISDDGTYDGKDVQRGNVTVPTTPPDTDTRTKLVDNYWVSYQAMDALMLKFGEYSCGFARVISTDGACGHNIQGTYSLDQADITLILSKITEGTDAGGDDGDVDETVLKVDVKEAGPFDTLAIYYNSMTDDTAAAGPEVSYTGIDLALPIVEHDRLAGQPQDHGLDPA